MQLSRLEKKGRLFYQYLVSYLLILLIPVTISIFLFNRASTVLSAEAQRANDLLLRQMKSNLDMVMTDVNQLRILVAYNERMEGLLYEKLPLDADEYYRAYQVANDFRTYHVGSPNIIDFYVYAAGLDMIVSPGGYFTSLNYHRTRMRSLGTSYDEWIGTFNAVGRLSYTHGSVEDHAGSPVRTVQMLYPLPASNQTGTPRGWLSVHVDQAHFSRALDGTAWSEESIVLVYHDEFGIVSSSRPEAGPALEQVAGQAAALARAGGRATVPDSVTIAGVRYVLLTQRSDVVTWSYVSLVPVGIYADRFTDLSRITVLAFLVCMLLGGFLIYWLSVVRYRPVHSLLELLQSDATGSISVGEDEFAVIRRSLEMTLAEDQELRQEVKKAKPIVAQRYLQQLLNGRIGDSRSARLELEEAGISFDHPLCTVILAELEDRANPDLRERSLAIIREFPFPGRVEVLRDIDGAVGVLVNHEPTVRISAAAAGLKAGIEALGEVELAVGVSDSAPTHEDLSILYRQARRALDFRLVKGRETPILFDQIRASNQSYYYPIEEEIKLINSIKAGDEEKAEAIVEEVFKRNFDGTPMSLEMGRCLMFDLIATMIKTVNSIVSREEDGAFWSRVRPITRLTACRSLEELRTEIGSTLTQTCGYVRDHRTDHTDQLRRDILSHIHENYRDPNLSPDHVATALDRNSAYLARFFREQMNVGMSSYIKRFRVDRAKQLLVDDDITLSDLATAVGFAGSNALIRAFKELEGVTPGQYRESARTPSSEAPDGGSDGHNGQRAGDAGAPFEPDPRESPESPSEPTVSETHVRNRR